MSSENRKNASRANGKLSRGPITEEGKRRSAENRLRHGILSRTLLLTDENPKAFKQLWTKLHKQFNPQTPHECLQLEKMIAATWRLQRIWTLEREFINSKTAQQDPGARPVARTMEALQAESTHGRFQDVLHRYETRFDRQYQRAYNLLKRDRET